MRSPNASASSIRSLIAASILAGLGGCTVGPDYHAAPATMPTTWHAVTAVASDSDRILSPTTADLAQWWTVLGDDTLNVLLSKAITQNFDVKIAVERVNQARALRGVAKSQQLPKVDAVGSYGRSRLSTNTPVGNSLSGDSFNDWQGGFDATWEIDLAGGIRRGVEAANADLAALDEARRDVLVRLLAETARDYVELRGSQRRLAVADETLKSQRDTLTLVKARRAAGSVSDLDVSRAEADVRLTEATIPSLQGDISESIFRIGALLGVEPGSLYEELVAAKAIPVPAKAVPVGLPSDLLRRRPDIRQAERQVAAATARIGVAVADYYPRVNLTGSFVMDASRLSRVGDWDSRQFGVGPSFSWNLFDGNRIANNVQFTESRQRESMIRYQQVVIESLKEVETAIIRYQREFARRQSLDEAVKNNERSVSLAKEQYQAGSIDLLEVLDTQRNLFASQDQLAVSDQTISTQLIALYKSLGGGWEGDDPATSQGTIAAK